MSEKKILEVLKNKPLIREICWKLKLIYKEKDVDINKVIQDMNLPLGVHLFITSNFSFLMSLIYK